MDGAGPSERANVTRLIRFLSVCVAVPTITIGMAFLLYAPDAHAFHMGAFLLLGAAAIMAYVVAPRLAARFVPHEMPVEAGVTSP